MIQATEPLWHTRLANALNLLMNLPVDKNAPGPVLENITES